MEKQIKKSSGKEYITLCDIGSIKIHDDNVSAFFSNGIGDIPTKVRIIDKEDPKASKGEFLGHFVVKNKAWLAGYDCDDSKVHEFKRGRWFVMQPRIGEIVIYKQDEDV